jgi:hypothetical protein
VVFLYVNPIVALLGVSTAPGAPGAVPYVCVSVVARKVLILSPYAKKGIGVQFSSKRLAIERAFRHPSMRRARFTSAGAATKDHSCMREVR